MPEPVTPAQCHARRAAIGLAALLLALLAASPPPAWAAAAAPCHPTPYLLQNERVSHWAAGPVVMGLVAKLADTTADRWQAYRAYKVFWQVPDDWTDGITVELVPPGGEVPLIQRRLPTPSRSGDYVLYPSVAMLEAAGCWEIRVIHRTEQHVFRVLADGPAAPPLLIETRAAESARADLATRAPGPWTVAAAVPARLPLEDTQTYPAWVLALRSGDDLKVAVVDAYSGEVAAVHPGTRFADMAGHWAHPAVAALAAAGVVDGTGPRTFLPSAPLTRAQWVKLLVLATGQAVPTTATTAFADLSGHW